MSSDAALSATFGSKIDIPLTDLAQRLGPQRIVLSHLVMQATSSMTALIHDCVHDAVSLIHDSPRASAANVHPLLAPTALIPRARAPLCVAVTLAIYGR